MTIAGCFAPGGGPGLADPGPGCHKFSRKPSGRDFKVGADGGGLRRGRLRRARPHVEIYLADPRRTKPEKLKTVLLGELESG